MMGFGGRRVVGFAAVGGIIGIGGRNCVIIDTGIIGSDIGVIPNGIPVKAIDIIGGGAIIPKGGIGGIPNGGGTFAVSVVSGSSVSFPASRFSCARRSSSGIPSIP
jgi:hypothetical protein